MTTTNPTNSPTTAGQLSIHKSRSPYFADGWYAEFLLASGDAELIGPYQSRKAATCAVVAVAEDRR